MPTRASPGTPAQALATIAALWLFVVTWWACTEGFGLFWGITLGWLPAAVIGGAAWLLMARWWPLVLAGLGVAQALIVYTG